MIQKIQKQKVAEFEGEVECKSKMIKELGLRTGHDFRRGELPGKYTVRILYGQNNEKFEEEYLRKLERNWWK